MPCYHTVCRHFITSVVYGCPRSCRRVLARSHLRGEFVLVRDGKPAATIVTAAAATDVAAFAGRASIPCAEDHGRNAAD